MLNSCLSSHQYLFHSLHFPVLSIIDSMWYKIKRNPSYCIANNISTSQKIHVSIIDSTSCLQNICYLKLYSWKLWISCSRRSQWMRKCSGKWLKIRCYSLWVRDFPFHCFIFIWKKNRLEVDCSVFLLFSRCIDHFICYSRIVYIGDTM